MSVEYRILGPVEAFVDGRPLRLGGPKQRATLAILLLSPNRVVSVERLADDLYAGAPPVTAVTQVQRQVSELRKLLGGGVIETRSPGYAIRVDRDALDLARFERLTADAAVALARRDPSSALALLDTALALWRGAPLADLAYETFAQVPIARLEELRLAMLEERFEAALALGRHAVVLGELEATAWEHPLRERLAALRMLALYRSGRQADALDVYARLRARLVDELGIEPTKTLANLQRQILTQDPALDPASPRASASYERTILVGGTAAPVLAAAAPLASLPERSLIVAELVHDEAALTESAATAKERCAALDVPARWAAFTSVEPARDLLRLAATYDVELIVVGAHADATTLANRAACDLAIAHGGPVVWESGSGIRVPFGGTDNDWAALELGAWLAHATSSPLRLVGTRADPARGRRDASRLLADASLATQQLVGVSPEPALTDPTDRALAAAVSDATLVVAGLPSRWRTDGLGSAHTALVARGAPTLLVQRGTRPGGLAPRESRTRFSWSLAG